MSAGPAGGASRVAISGELTIQSAAAVRAQLLSALRDGAAIDVDLADVSEFDSSGLQLLVAAQKSAAAAGKRLRLVSPSPPVVDVMVFLSMLDQFAWADAEEAP